VLDLNGLIEDLARMLTRIIGEDMVLELNLASDLGNVRVDPGQIEQVLMNLAVNARDAMPDGGAISIETSNTSIDEAYVAQHVGAKPGRYAAIAVSDSGCGMDASVLERIFEPFFTTKAVGDGTGLGLATAYGIVKQHNGNIWAYSEPGLGSTFRIYLPAVDDAIERDKDLALVDTPLTGAETILAVEDEHTVLRIVRRILTEFGYSVLTAASASEAERIFDENRDDISLLLADVIMPDVNGPALFETLRAKNAGLKVLYISGYTKRTATRAGGLPDDAPFLQKPFPPEVLARHVRDVLDA
jgi:CheY-like chemotaxis protein